MKKPKVLLIDGKYFMYKSISTNTVLSFNEFNTTMYYYMLSSIKSIAKKFQPDNTIILWDSRHSFRKKIFPAYKKKDIVNDLIQQQLDYIRDEYENLIITMEGLGFASYLRWGLEADDLFSLYCEQNQLKEEIVIASKDEDLYQLLHENVCIFDPKEKKIKTKNWFTKKYGIPVEQWALFKAIGGCKSDKIPGLKGIADVITLRYLKGEASQKEVENIKSQQELINFYLQLTLLPFQNPGQRKSLLLKKKYTDIDLNVLIELCQKFGFKSFLNDWDEWKLFSRKK